MTRTLGRHYIPFFPIGENEMPANVDPYRGAACHCALGTMYQVLTVCGVDVDHELPWVRPGFSSTKCPMEV